jgi:hypothetical protein
LIINTEAPTTRDEPVPLPDVPLALDVAVELVPDELEPLLVEPLPPAVPLLVLLLLLAGASVPTENVTRRQSAFAL